MLQAMDQTDEEKNTGVRLLNSFTRRVEPLRCRSGGRRVGMYVCGPTVYDSAHLGHARNYVAFDTIRRVLRDFFSLDVRFVMNITDVDDKIVLKAHQSRADQLLSVAQTVEQKFSSKESQRHLESALGDVRCLVEAGSKDLAAISDACDKLCSTMLSAFSDDGSPSASLHRSLLRLAPSSWEPKTGAQEISRQFEASFLSNMRRLNVEHPDAMPRVSEYMPEIEECIQCIVEKGFAYTCNGSVYFDTVAFNNDSNHRYGKLRASALDDVDDAMAGEGALTSLSESEKRNRSDFALWKAARAGEPAWESSFGPGRPGWHIECSAMCSKLLGPTVEINAGGCDLEFPHHENQVAQSEAYWDSNEWALSFVHAGHLHISGQKMSKSLKNFVTIDAALEKHGWRALRMMFLLKQWSDPMEITPCDDGSISQAPQAESILSIFDNFLDTCEFHLSKGFNEQRQQLHQQQQQCNGNDQKGKELELKWGNEEFEFEQCLTSGKQSVHSALANNVQTPLALKELRNIVHETYNYLNVCFNLSFVCSVDLVASLFGL